MRVRYEKSFSTMAVFIVLMSSSALHANNIYFSEDGLINLENSSLHADDGLVEYVICEAVLLLKSEGLAVAHCLGRSFGKFH
ncbi:hypothetical protein [Delftia sp. RIT313]|uniref:hypothetical protein n=1 Tax=Delftia sp. RIT313 TaxID=1468410 RepID=UPI0012695474|nr:hypothetical protein [Delftia sp. RIT313]